MQIACYIRCDATFRHVQTVLAHAGFDSIRFTSETALLRTMRRQDFNLILVETDNKAADDEGIYSWLNCRTGESTPVVLLSAVHNPNQVARALDAGADDCIQQPFESVELVARIHAILRRTNKKNTRRTIEALGFRLDQETYRMYDRGVEVDLTPREFTMAWMFFSSPGTYLSRSTISTAIWGVDSDIAARTIEQHIYKLRKKLNLSTERGAMIRTAYTKGYCLQLNEEAAANPGSPVLDLLATVAESGGRQTLHADEMPVAPKRMKSADLAMV